MASARDLRRFRRVPGVAVQIATNACLDAIRRANRRLPSRRSSCSRVPWLQPYPDDLLDEIAPREAEPDAVAVSRETIELRSSRRSAAAAAPARGPDPAGVLEWSARETAALLDMTVVAVNSALQRARATMAANRPHGRDGRRRPADRGGARAAPAVDRGHDRAEVAAMVGDASRRRPHHDAAEPLLVQREGRFLPGLEVG